MIDADSTDNCFIEIIHKPYEEVFPEWIECYIIENLDPKCCGPLARDLNAILPLRISTQTNNVQSTTPSCITEEHDTTIFPNTEHLKRIQRRPATDKEVRSRKIEDDYPTKQDSKESTNGDVSDKHPTKKAKINNNKKKQSSYSLDILVGSVSAVDDHLCSKESTSTSLSLTTILERYNLSTSTSSFIRKSLPGRPAQTKDELNQWNTSIWPTLFYEEKTVQYKEEQLALTFEEVEMMKKGMDEALKDALVAQKQCKAWREDYTTAGNNEILSTLSGVVVLNPKNDVVVSKASDERHLQAIMSEEDALEEKKSKGQSTAVCIDKWTCFPEEVNPLCTPVLLAIQGVSRQERQMALGVGMESEEFKRGQVKICD